MTACILHWWVTQGDDAVHESIQLKTDAWKFRAVCFSEKSFYEFEEQLYNR